MCAILHSGMPGKVELCYEDVHLGHHHRVGGRHGDERQVDDKCQDGGPVVENVTRFGAPLLLLSSGFNEIKRKEREMIQRSKICIIIAKRFVISSF